jgi:hypothetical protein
MSPSINKFGLIMLVLLIAVGGTLFFLRKEVPKLYINEFMASNSACCPDSFGPESESDDWIEIYNAGSVPEDIGGMYFSQKNEQPLGFLIPKTNPNLTTIPPGGFLLLWADANPDKGVLHLDFKLDADGEFLGLYDKNGRTIDSYEFKGQKENKSFGRTLDGADTWKEFSGPTPGKSNN